MKRGPELELAEALRLMLEKATAPAMSNAREYWRDTVRTARAVLASYTALRSWEKAPPAASSQAADVEQLRRCLHRWAAIHRPTHANHHHGDVCTLLGWTDRLLGYHVEPESSPPEGSSHACTRSK